MSLFLNTVQVDTISIYLLTDLKKSDPVSGQTMSQQNGVRFISSDLNLILIVFFRTLALAILVSISKLLFASLKLQIFDNFYTDQH